MTETVRARVLKPGHDRVFTGAYDESTRQFTKFAAGEEFEIAPDIAEALVERGFVEVLRQTQVVVAAPLPTPVSPPAIAPSPTPEPALLKPAPFQESPWRPIAEIPAEEGERQKWSTLALARLKLNAKRNAETGCLEWQGAKQDRGYGVITLLRMSYAVHRLSWLAQRGNIPKGLYVCHSCDNPACFEISHLFLGTPQENMDDMVHKGRGRRVGRPVLTEEKVAEIKRKLGERFSIAELSREYGMGYRAIADIKHERSWRRVKPA